MRKLKLQVQMTLDGYVGGPNGEMDWVSFNWDDELKSYVTELTAGIDTIVLGRRLAEGFIPYWRAVAEDAANPEQAAGRIFTDTPKVVFSKTLAESPWPGTTLAKGPLAEEIQTLKAAEGKDIIAYGGATFVSALIEEGLVDELHLFLNPTAIGNGLSVFSGRTGLALQKATPFACGIVVLQYAPRH
ncbi:MAG: dihydrofolate reductase [Chitinophagaceae bacterium]|nr:MAG: dihydrofolate reductase [Chitinophagaceae bacterium]